MSISIKDALHNQLEEVYLTKGYGVLIDKAWKILTLSESKTYEDKYRKVKGEIAEIVLEYSLCELQKTIKYPTVVLKGLCIPFRTGREVTTEMDLVFITPYKIYMFECKSYKNNPTLTDKCLLNGKTDIYYQQKLHTTALHQYLFNCIKSSPSKPYKCIMFEMSTEGINDKRSDVYKKSMPVINPNNVMEFLTQQLNENSKVPEFIDVKRTVNILTELDNNSKKMFEKHLTRLTGKPTE